MRGMLLAMSAMLRSGSPRRLAVVLGLALMWLVFAASAAGAAPLDTVTATGSADISPNQGIPLPAQYTGININAQSGTSGQNPSGTASFTLVSSGIPGSLTLAGPITCLNVLGPDHGAGTSGSPTTAVLTFMNTTTITLPVISVTLVDNGGNGADIINSRPGASPTDCSQPFTGTTGTFTNGRAVVVDATPFPTSKDQCKHGGYAQFGFKNQGQCVAFVERGPKG